MKRYPIPAIMRSHQKRRGALFHYYMMYLFLTSILLTTAGMCIHTILKADRLDSQVASYLQTLLRMEGSFRQDLTTASASTGDDSMIELTTTEGQPVVRWTLTDNVAKRQTIADPDAATSDRFVFQRGTMLGFAREGQQVTLTLTEPSAMPANTNGTAPTLTKSVQIIAMIKRPESPAPSAAVENASTTADEIEEATNNSADKPVTEGSAS